MHADDHPGGRRFQPFMMRRSIPILCYHAIDASDHADGTSGHPRRLFAQHLEAIRRLGFVTLSASDLLDICAGTRPLDRRYLLLTFDDGHLSHWLHAAPMLAERNMTGVFFTVTDLIRPGVPRDAAQAPSPLPAGAAFRQAVAAGDCSSFMNESELAALVRDFGMEVHSHSAAHQACFRNLRRIGQVTESIEEHWTARSVYPGYRAGLPLFDAGSAYAYDGFWPRHGPDAAPSFHLRTESERYEFCLQDFRRSLARVAAINRAGRQMLCWPWGQFDDVAVAAARAAGFDGAFTLERTPNGPGTDPFRLGRIRVRPSKGAGWLAARLAAHGTASGAALLAKRFRKQPEPRRVLYLTDSTAMSGGSRQLVNNVTAMAEHGVDTLVAAPEGSAVADVLERRGATVIRWDQPRRLVPSARFIAGVTRSRGVDVVHTFHSRPAKAAVLARLFGGRFRLYLNRGVVHRPNPLTALFAVIGEGVICNSQAAARVLRRHLIPRTRISVVYNAIESAYQSAPEARQPAHGPAALRVIWVGNGSPVKGYDVLRRVAAEYTRRYPVPEVAFLAYGVGRSDPITGAGGAAAPAPVSPAGPVGADAVRQAMAGADVFLLTSRRESLPNVVLEAFSAGLPVVCTDAGGVGEIVHDGINGLVRPVEDVGALVDALHSVVADPERRLELGARGRRLANDSLTIARKGALLLRVYSGERVSDTVAWDGSDWEVPVW